MYDVSSGFEEFYTDDVVLPQSDQKELREKKRINIDRLKSGLEAYNNENRTSYKIAENRVQGSMAMSTVIQNDKKDYDIDVAIIFDKVNIGDMGPRQARNLVKAALDMKNGNFANKAEVKTNCVRIVYQDGYHVDFAVYRRYKKDSETNYTYDHAGGNSWNYRDPAAITNWFSDEIKAKGTDLRKVIRLSKMFCKSRDSWGDMPGGLIQTVVIDECFTEGNRIDETFYNTMEAVRKRLEQNNEVYNPTDPDISLLLTQAHHDKVDRWCSHLGNELDKLGVLFSDDCTLADALEAWHGFFNHDFWAVEVAALNESADIYKSFNLDSRATYDNTEEFLEEENIIINDHYKAWISCDIKSRGFPRQNIFVFFRKFPFLKNHIPRGPQLFFRLDTDAPQYDAIWWKVRNVGVEAEKRNDIRGQIEKQWGRTKEEHSLFEGPHFVEAYVIMGRECIAIARYDATISPIDIK